MVDSQVFSVLFGPISVNNCTHSPEFFLAILDLKEAKDLLLILQQVAGGLPHGYLLSSEIAGLSSQPHVTSL